jgi:hypothetical protein
MVAGVDLGGAHVQHPQGSHHGQVFAMSAAYERGLAAALAAVLTAASARAQAPDYFAALSIPPTSVGTCTMLPERGDSTLHTKAHAPAHHLVIVSQPPGARREMIVLTDLAGKPIRYVEHISDFEPPARGTSADVVASFDTAGVVKGTLTRRFTTVTLPAPGARVDSAALSRMRQSTKTSTARTTLDAARQAQVDRVAGWLVRRCPAGR